MLSDTKLSCCCGMANAVRSWPANFPSLTVTAEKDMVRSGAYL